MDGLFLELLFSIVLTAIVYMAFPFIRLAMNRGRFERKRAKRIALWNSIVWGAIFCIATAVFSDGTGWNAAPAFLYYWINCALLTRKDDDADLPDNVTQQTKREEITVRGDNNTNNHELLSVASVVQREVSAHSSPSENPHRHGKPILFCRKCGHRLVEGYVFCNKCGTKISSNNAVN